MKYFTVGYGGRKPDDLVALLRSAGIRTLVDVRLRPDKANMGIFSLSKDPQKGIKGLLGKASIQYVSFIEMGNMFYGRPDWVQQYRQLIERAGDLLLARLSEVPGPACLMCAEKHAAECHRSMLGDYLKKQGHEVVHLE
jgi:uncharacterized protein (DUF488 family)